MVFIKLSMHRDHAAVRMLHNFILCSLLVCSFTLSAQVDKAFVHDISRHDRFLSASLSGDGRYVAVIDYVMGGYHLGIVDTDAKSYRNDIIKDTVHVSQVKWYGNDQILIVDTKLNGSSYIYLYDINTDHYEVVFYSPIENSNIDAEIIHSNPGSDTGVVVRLGTRIPKFYSVDVKKRSRKEINIGIENVSSLYINNESQAYAATQINKSKYTVLIKPNEDDSDWLPLLSGDIYGKDDPHLLFIDSDNHTLWVSAHQDSDLRGVWAYDTEAKMFSMAPVLADSNYDIQANLLIDDVSGNVAAIHYQKDYPYTYYLDANVEAVVNKIANVLADGRIRLVDMATEAQRYLFAYQSDIKPTQWYLYSAMENKLVLIGSQNERLDKYTMYERKPVRFKARDGLEIEAYMTLPPAPVKGLIVNPHGGPEYRDFWGFDDWAQLLARHGYAVIQPNFRGSTGYGRAFNDSAIKQYGKTMQYDLEDAISWALKTYELPPDKVCAVGGSYGAYASVNLLYSASELVNCAAGIAGFYDAVQLLQDDEDKLFADSQKYRMGDPDADLELLTEISPINQVAADNGPVLLIHGRYDERIDYQHSVKMHAAIQEVGGRSELNIINSEGHAFRKQSSTKNMYLQLLRFLQENIDKNTVQHTSTS